MKWISFLIIYFDLLYTYYILLVESDVKKDSNSYKTLNMVLTVLNSISMYSSHVCPKTLFFNPLYSRTHCRCKDNACQCHLFQNQTLVGSTWMNSKHKLDQSNICRHGIPSLSEKPISGMISVKRVPEGNNEQGERATSFA